MENRKKICIKCHEERFLDQFYPHSGMKEGRLNKCRSCAILEAKERHKTLDKTKRNIQHRNLYPLTKDRNLRSRYKREYGITVEEFNKIFESQNGCCLICNMHQKDLSRRLCVDHCHSEKRIRGLLCNNCNAGIGMFKDNVNILENALVYLKRSKLKLAENN